MSIFKTHKTLADRSATDRSRHKKKIEKAIREGIHNIVSDESIIGKDGKKKIKIPVRGIKEYKFVYSDNDTNKKVGSAPGKNIKRGQKIGDKKPKPQDGGDQPGKDAGEEFYEVEITLEELSSYLFDSLDLPDLEKKKFKKMVGDKFKRSGYRYQGIKPRLSKKETLKRKIRRKKAHDFHKAEKDEEDRFPFHENDLKYKHIRIKPKENSNAVIFFIMDVSGSMTKNKKFIARSFFFILYHFIRHKYDNTEIVFISHTVDAKEVSEDDFFNRGSSGGTFVSSGVEKCIEIANKRYHKDSWNIYAFHCSDGDNWPEDNEKAVKLSISLKELSQLYCFIQIKPDDIIDSWGEHSISNSYESLVDKKFKIININNSDQIWNQFKRIFGGKLDG